MVASFDWCIKAAFQAAFCFWTFKEPKNILFKCKKVLKANE